MIQTVLCEDKINVVKQMSENHTVNERWLKHDLTE